MLTRPTDPPDAVLRYADHADGLVDLFWPPSMEAPVQPSPLVVLLHGGFWRQRWDRTHLRPLAWALARAGRVVAVPEYRRVGGLGGWPHTGEDAEAALRVVADGVEQVSPGRVDPTAPYALAGHSAGGHLALWAGLRAGPQRVAGIVALAPVADLAAAARAGIGDDAVSALLGRDAGRDPQRYAAADPAGLLPGDVPVTIVQGADDEDVPAALNRALATRIPALSYVEVEGVEHFALIDPWSPVCVETVLPTILATA